MLTMSDPNTGTTLLIFSTEEDLKQHIENLQNLAKHCEGDKYPGVYACYPEVGKATEDDQDELISNAKKAAAILLGESL